MPIQLYICNNRSCNNPSCQWYYPFDVNCKHMKLQSGIPPILIIKYKNDKKLWVCWNLNRSGANNKHFAIIPYNKGDIKL